ncbi:MAG TPA: AbrB/MazE/SpoVT family DNA-binding domain-containing protein [Terracidiphilus sp.]|jgi:AbrB family looped-hinge helix DNA binding protein|nr:AbrB/MazE/SpoVT family DNA-binding domain-containing protein [Terracidiphilus sp.]
MAETVVLGESGRIVLPASIRKEFGLEPGERLTVSSEKGEIRIMSRRMALESLRASIVARRGSLKGILDEFLEERREEAGRELAGE